MLFNSKATDCWALIFFFSLWLFKCYVLHWANILCLSPILPCLAKDTDIVDEAIYYFKANVFFKNYEIKVKYKTFAL